MMTEGRRKALRFGDKVCCVRRRSNGELWGVQPREIEEVIFLSATERLRTNNVASPGLSRGEAEVFCISDEDMYDNRDAALRSILRAMSIKGKDLHRRAGELGKDIIEGAGPWWGTPPVSRSLPAPDDSVFNARREELEKAITDAVAALFEHMRGAGAFVLNIPHGEEQADDLVIAAGPVTDVQGMLHLHFGAAPIISTGNTQEGDGGGSPSGLPPDQPS